MRITMIGHSSVLIETAGKKILTDPYWSKWGNPAYARVGVPAKLRSELKDVDCVLISHGHFDHVDRKYLRMIGETPVITPQSTRWFIRLLGGRNVSGIRSGEHINIGDVAVSAVPASHLVPTVGFIIKSENRQIYFSGDTYYKPFMEDIGRAFKLDVGDDISYSNDYGGEASGKSRASLKTGNHNSNPLRTQTAVAFSSNESDP
jgi:L-ascorbate metabolism protein UlaG (beta-lactamase superfamily)